MQLLAHFASLTLHPKNAQELKGLILKLAVQGKLTANWRKANPNIESAGDLMKLIIKARKNLVLDKKVKDFGDFKSLNQLNQLHDLPEKWIWCRLGDITDLPYGKGLTSKELLAEGYDVFGANGIIGKYHTYLYEDNMLLISCRGAYSGKTNISPKKCFVTSNSLVCEFYNPKATKFEYYFYAISAIPTNLIVTGSAQPQVTATNARELALPLPPIEEQKEIVRIAEILFKEVKQLEQLTVKRIALKNEYVTSAIQQLTKQNSQKEWQSLQPHFKDFFTEKSTIKKLRETVLQLAVQGKLTADWRTKNKDFEPASELLKRIQKEKAQLIKDKKIKDEKQISSITLKEIPFSLPESWTWCRMQDLCPNISSGSTPPKPYFKEEGIPYLKVYNIKNQKIDFEYRKQFVDKEYHLTKLKRSILKPGDVIMNIVGPPLGKVAIIPDDFPQWNCNQAISFFQPLDRKLNTWIYTFLLAGSFLDHIELIGTAGQDNISVTKSKTIMLPLPPFEEQKAIVEKVNALMGLCDALEQEVAQSKGYSEQLMQSVLREVFEGEKV